MSSCGLNLNGIRTLYSVNGRWTNKVMYGTLPDDLNQTVENIEVLNPAANAVQGYFVRIGTKILLLPQYLQSCGGSTLIE
jgi:hypothetical protein